MTEQQLLIMHIIKDNPGIRFCEIKRRSGMNNGVLSYHLQKMESAGRIRVKRGARQTSYSTLDITKAQLKVAYALQRSTPRAILLALADQDGRRFADLARYCKKSPPTTSHYLTRMVKEGLVKCVWFESGKRYYTNCRREMDVLADVYRPTPTEKLVSGFEDIITSL